jgi:uncharacterized protein
MLDQNRWESLCEHFLRDRGESDPAHGMDHVKRVVANALQLAEIEGASLEVVLPAAWLHDCVVVPKDSSGRSTASRMAARTAREWLQTEGYDPACIDEIEHAIAAHSFSAGIRPRTIEAKVVQDADRLDSLGAIGIARCLVLGGGLDRPLYDMVDPFCERRDPDDSVSTIDHFYTKLLLLRESMQTDSGRKEAARRTEFMVAYLRELALELGTSPVG